MKNVVHYLDFSETKFHPCQYTKQLLNKIYLLNKKTTLTNQVNLKEINKAIYYARKYHGNQKRKTGEPFYYHPLEVANITTEYIFDTETIVSALLHDVIEDTNCHLSQIELIFGIMVANIVDAVTKISFDLLLSKEETFNKINVFQDPYLKATTIKVIDRLHNMRTISSINSIDKQKKIAKETMQFYIPLAKYANLCSIANELQDIVIRILNL